MEIYKDLFLTEKEIIGIYLLLKDNELKLDKTMQMLYNNLEKRIQSELTIEEFENIKELYE
jgi:hypothetical protein